MDQKTAINRTSSGTGIILGKYQLGRLLGRGSFAKVYHAKSLTDDSTAAVKVIDKSSVAAVGMETRIVSEIDAMRRLSRHPNIIQIHEVLATKTKIYLVMELARGDLFSLIGRRGRMPESVARRYFQQLVSALSFCHENGISHRDIKPQNLLINDSGDLKISDFGLSALPEQIRGDGSGTGKSGMLYTSCGTPGYTAPEVFSRRGTGYDGGKADAWSCGVILYVLLAGSLPFDDSNLLNMYQKMRRSEFEFPSWISKQAKNAIRKLLDPNANTRLTINSLMGLNWFKKSLESNPSPDLLDQLPSNECKFTNSSMTAFDIISLSSGLDLSGLFEQKCNRKRERRFTSRVSIRETEDVVGQVGEKLGYKVRRRKEGSFGLIKGKTVLLAEILAVTPAVSLVVVTVVECGGAAAEMEELNWDDLRIGFDDIVLSWHNNNDGILNNCL
ncbi:CBL-interacting serine/threonine-protein kinase 7 [Impatiens glandulifera]|uniref:CBL-interacting serine/threonine-protein kinase 7 n=1 Tax=Impatiens glandulifera TaxID=253017 RepID=UPI001FB1863E|nr:CBL-interacting serine/threonine-protein kinase 7 [Impatiens glandulifera]